PPFENGKYKEELAFVGGRTFILHTVGMVHSANITPSKETGIGKWSRDYFINYFKQFDIPADSLPGVPANQFNTAMPWSMYAGMTKEDLGAVYTYLNVFRLNK